MLRTPSDDSADRNKHIQVIPVGVSTVKYDSGAWHNAMRVQVSEGKQNNFGRNRFPSFYSDAPGSNTRLHTPLRDARPPRPRQNFTSTSSLPPRRRAAATAMRAGEHGVYAECRLATGGLRNASDGPVISLPWSPHPDQIVTSKKRHAPIRSLFRYAVCHGVSGAESSTGNEYGRWGSGCDCLRLPRRGVCFQAVQREEKYCGCHEQCCRRHLRREGGCRLPKCCQ